MSVSLFFTCLGYLSGSVLYARCFAALLNKGDIVSQSPDQNPGAFNAFRQGGFLCGSLTLCCDVLKGFLPVYFYLCKVARTPAPDVGLAFVLAAPVFGHILPVFHKFHGGKGISVSFGCLLGLLPEYRPALILAAFFLLFSLVIKITPNYHRTLFAYLSSAAGMLVFVPNPYISSGFMLIAGLITLKLLFSPEKKEKCKVEAIWKS